ncbi:SusD/RagB family nutrient-binding outer membrane lipoprotein [Nemorincola caseinilytica]|uniref:SusD/RagB family nutrient-binding outer membrane lipoprotein n=1 Tax=Nemorincola caseinilytica TaxID=2054315 RepID=A0ABP8NK00_9BACT
MKKSLLILCAIVLATQYSCRKTLNVNTNPNEPADVTVTELLPAAEISLSHQYGNYFQLVGGLWAQYWTQSPSASQYRPFEQYQPGPSSANTAWQELYAGTLTDLRQIVKKAGTAENTKNYTAVAKILQGYTLQLLTDNFGDIPFTDALKGEDGVTSPRYDRQQDIYPAIIALVREGRDLIDVDALGPGTDDVIFHGDMYAWGQFANTLLLRMNLRMAYVDPTTAMAGVAEAQANSYGFLEATAQIAYSSSPGNAYPFYSEISNLGFTQNVVASATAVNAMLANEDVRIFSFYTGTVGLQQGYYGTPSPGSYSLPSALTGANANDPSSATAPVKLLSSYESLFLQAEAAARAGAASAAMDLYNAAIGANFLEYELTADDAETYILDVAGYPLAGTMEEQIEAIITQKWFAMTGNQNIEAWTEWRRTGYPDIFTISRASRIGNQFPMRLPYPETELTRNLNFPGQKNITDRVWWDVQ